MNFSKIHFELAKNLNEIKVLTDPQEFLGPNWEKVLEFWWAIESLSEEEMEGIVDSYEDLDCVERFFYSEHAEDKAIKIVGEKLCEDSWIDVAHYFVFGDATNELIADVENKIFYDLIMNHIKWHKPN
jgi:hypothetical protein